MKKQNSVQANLSAAKLAVEEMTKQWNKWKKAQNEQSKLLCIGAYAAAFTSCKVYIENYLKHKYPNEKNLPMQVLDDIRNFVKDMEVIEKVNEKVLQKVLKDIDQLGRHAA
jgi:hypothetical protein